MDYFLIDEGHIHLSYSTSVNQYGSLTCEKYKKRFFAFSRSNENSLLEITAHKTMRRFEFQYITVIMTKVVSQNKSDVESSMFGRMMYNRRICSIEYTFA